jgi:hypothetical protein
MSESKKDITGWAFLKNVANEQEAAIVEATLGMEGIPVRIKHRENGAYLAVYMGMSNYGLDVFVPEEALEAAEELLNSEVLDIPEETGCEELIEDGRRYERKRRVIVWSILVYLFMPVILAFIGMAIWYLVTGK